MRRAFGPRTAVEAVFLVAVPVVSWQAGLSSYAIVAASAIGYLLVLLVEGLLWRRGPSVALPAGMRKQAVEPSAVARAAPPEPFAVPEPVAEPERGAEAESQAEPDHAAEPEPAPEPERESELEPEPEPVRILQPVPDLEPERELELEPVPEPPPAATVVRLGVDAEPRRWNLWDLERATRDGAGEDTLRDEERSFLLMYLREFAGPDGLLPVDFDRLVRDSFGELVEAW